MYKLDEAYWWLKHEEQPVQNISQKYKTILQKPSKNVFFTSETHVFFFTITFISILSLKTMQNSNKSLA